MQLHGFQSTEEQVSFWEIKKNAFAGNFKSNNWWRIHNTHIGAIF